MKNKTISVHGELVSVFQLGNDDYISLTDIAKTKESDSRAADIIKNWIRNRGTLEFIGTWEQIYNPNFKVVEFDHFKKLINLLSGLPIATILLTDKVRKKLMLFLRAHLLMK